MSKVIAYYSFVNNWLINSNVFTKKGVCMADPFLVYRMIINYG
jgi:hypothetical protein